MRSPTPTAADIVALRWRVTVVLRLLAVLLAICALAWAAIRIPEFRQIQKFSASGMSMKPRYFELSWFAIPIVMFGSSIALVVVGQFAMRFLVPVPKPKCPGCGYDLSEPTSDRCPECGLHIGTPRANDPT